mgnify:CR=1 FL=1
MDPPSVATQGLTVEPPQSLEGRESESDVKTPVPEEIPPRQEMSNDKPLGSGEDAVEDPAGLVGARQIFREKGAPLPLPPIPRPPRPQSRSHRNRSRWLKALALWEVADRMRWSINAQWGADFRTNGWLGQISRAKRSSLQLITSTQARSPAA